MKFILDENMPRSLVDELYALGHDAVHARDVGLRGAADEIVAERALRESRCLISLDYDFGDIRAYPPEQYHGIIVLSPRPNASKREINQLAVAFLTDDSMRGLIDRHLVIVEPSRVRVRPAES